MHPRHAVSDYHDPVEAVAPPFIESRQRAMTYNKGRTVFVRCRPSKFEALEMSTALCQLSYIPHSVLALGGITGFEPATSGSKSL